MSPLISRRGILPPPFLRGALDIMEGIETQNRTILHKVAALILNTFGWAGILIGIEITGQYLAIGGSAPNWLVVVSLVIIGVILLVLSAVWPLRSAESHSFFSSLFFPIMAYRKSWVTAVVLLLWVSLSLQIHSLRSDIDTYVMPRQLTQEQASEVQSYLMSREPHSIEVKVNSTDQEAIEYASQIQSAIKRGGWDVKFDTPVDDIQVNTTTGLATWEDGENSRSNDPRHDPKQLVLEAFQSAHVVFNGGGGASAGTYKLFIIVGRRPLALNRNLPLLYVLGRWLIRLTGLP